MGTLLDGGLGQADEDGLGKGGVGDIDLHLDRQSINAQQRGRIHRFAPTIIAIQCISAVIFVVWYFERAHFWHFGQSWVERVASTRRRMGVLQT